MKNLLEWEYKILMIVCIKFELDFNTELPGDSFYKRIALQICREYKIDYGALKSNFYNVSFGGVV